jgi:hypothetical protein
MSHGYGFSLECILIYVYLRPFHIYHKNTFFMCGSFSGQILTNYFRKIILLILIYILYYISYNSTLSKLFIAILKVKEGYYRKSS